MKNLKRININHLPVFGLILLMLLSVVGCSKQTSSTPATPEIPVMQTIVDMSGRSVTIPKNIQKVATIGSVPVINSFIFALGEGDKIVNGLPSFAQSLRWKYQTVFAPTMKDKPVLQNGTNEPNIEALLKVRPDVVFTLDQKSAQVMTEKGIPAIYLAWTQPEDVKKVMAIVGKVFNKDVQAQDYIKFFDDTVKKVNTVVTNIPQGQRPKVLYADIEKLSQPHLIVEWWIPTAGGISVTNNGRTTESVAFDYEQLLKWNPDILIVADAKTIDTVYSEPKLAQLSAVKNKRVLVAPMGAHTWANRTIEQPLTVLWAAKTFYPDRFKELDLEKEVKNFYTQFFKTDLNETQVKEIISGNIK